MLFRSIAVTLEQRDIEMHGVSGHLHLQPGPYVFLEISDTGTGIPEALRSKIFDPFYTTKPKDKGTGLGLAQVKHILEANGAGFVMKTAQGEGTAFEIYWPCLRNAPQVEPKHSPDASLSGQGVILLVEDQAEVRDTTTRILQQQGYTVLAADNGRQALQRYLSSPQPIDLVLTDLIMPEMNGKDLAIELLTIDPDLPIIVWSGYHDQISEHDLMHCGIEHVLAKPVDWQQLGELIASLI